MRTIFGNGEGISSRIYWGYLILILTGMRPGEVGQPMTKSWQYVKTLLKISRADLTLYSTRHLMGDWLDAAGVAQRTRDRILGHASAVPGRYGRKSKIDPEQIAAIEKLEPGVVKTMREILMAAKGKAGRGEWIVLKPWIKATP